MYHRMTFIEMGKPVSDPQRDSVSREIQDNPEISDRTASWGERWTVRVEAMKFQFETCRNSQVRVTILPMEQFTFMTLYTGFISTPESQKFYEFSSRKMESSFLWVASFRRHTSASETTHSLTAITIYLSPRGSARSRQNPNSNLAEQKMFGDKLTKRARFATSQAAWRVTSRRTPKWRLRLI